MQMSIEKGRDPPLLGGSCVSTKLFLTWMCCRVRTSAHDMRSALPLRNYFTLMDIISGLELCCLTKCTNGKHFRLDWSLIQAAIS